MLSPTTSFADVECDTMVEDSRKNEFLNEKIEELGTLVSETNNRLSDFEAENVLLKTQLDESQKLNVINAEKISAMAEMNDEAKAKATNLKDQFDDAKKMHETERQELHEKLEITRKFEENLVVVKKNMTELHTIYVKTVGEFMDLKEQTTESEQKLQSEMKQLGEAKLEIEKFKTHIEEMKKKNKIEKQELTDKFNKEKDEINRAHNTAINEVKDSNTEVHQVATQKVGSLLKLFM